jgi:hypothetical protein
MIDKLASREVNEIIEDAWKIPNRAYDIKGAKVISPIQAMII